MEHVEVETYKEYQDNGDKDSSLFDVVKVALHEFLASHGHLFARLSDLGVNGFVVRGCAVLFGTVALDGGMGVVMGQSLALANAFDATAGRTVVSMSLVFLVARLLLGLVEQAGDDVAQVGPRSGVGLGCSGFGGNVFLHRGRKT